PDGCWIWKGSNGAVQLAAGSNAEVTAEGIKLDPEGTTDLRLTIDTNNLTNGHVLAQPVTVKGTFADWSKDPAFDDGTHGDATAGDKIYTYTLSANAVRRLKLSSGTNAEFIWMLGDVEYKNANSEGNSDGVKAYTKGTTGDFTERSIIVMDNKNTAVAIP
ncbi:MAG TPA: choice-of-anchor X domain-containing protein, partial [Aggregicoccus sp.]|nr:choice-of-anchor X domain-containing protein [Aggregicoccus sp.]